jgi:large subunit ribosomal protein L32
MSRSNTRSRRSQWKAAAVNLVDCSNPACDAKRLPHTACSVCGTYGKGESGKALHPLRQVIEVN